MISFLPNGTGRLLRPAGAALRHVQGIYAGARGKGNRVLISDTIDLNTLVVSLCVSPSGRLVAWLAPSGKLALANVSGLLRHAYTVSAGTAYDAVAISPHDRLLLTAQGRVVTAWDIATGVQVFRHTVPALIGAIAVAPDDKHLAILQTNGAISLCDIGPHPDVAEIGSHGPVTSPCLAFSSDGARLATGGDHMVKIWQLQLPREPDVMTSAVGQPQRVSAPHDQGLPAGGAHWQACRNKAGRIRPRNPPCARRTRPRHAAARGSSRLVSPRSPGAPEAWTELVASLNAQPCSR